MDVDAFVEMVSEVGLKASLRTPTHEPNGGQDMAVRFLRTVATSTPSEAPSDAVQIATVLLSTSISILSAAFPKTATSPYRLETVASHVKWLATENKRSLKGP